MPFERTRRALLDIQENIALAHTFIEGMTYGTFEKDRRAVYAVTRALEIISEAARRLPDEVMDRHPEIPWKDVRGAGNIYRHDYEDVLETMLWATVKHALDPLDRAVREELARRRPEGE